MSGWLILLVLFLYVSVFFHKAIDYLKEMRDEK